MIQIVMVALARELKCKQMIEVSQHYIRWTAIAKRKKNHKVCGGDDNDVLV